MGREGGGRVSGKGGRGRRAGKRGGREAGG